jgi:Fic family protein
VFEPVFKITPKMASALMEIEATKQAIAYLPITAKAQARLRETARLLSTHYSTQIEGNRLTLNEATRVIKENEHFVGRQRDEKEVLGYYRALDELEKIVKAPKPKISESTIKTLHALVMGGKSGNVKPSTYRDGQNVIRDSQSNTIVYLPPEAKDVPDLMQYLILWLDRSDKEGLPCPLRSAIAHYQFATIHPYFDGNGRTARLLATLILYLGGYDLKGFYSLEEYYARDLNLYYEALAVGPSHNYYMGRETTDITAWIEYFCDGMLSAFNAVKRQAEVEAKHNKKDHTKALRALDARQRKALALFVKSNEVTAAQVGNLFNIQPRTARVLCQKWVDLDFLVISDPAKKSRKYRLARRFLSLVTN